MTWRTLKLNPSLKPVIILILGGLVVVAVATLKPAPEPTPVQPPPPVKVAVILAAPSTQSLTVNSQGTVAPRREIDLVAEVSGRITQVDPHFVDGAFVKAHKALVTIDPRDYNVALLRAEAKVADAQQVLATERGRNRQAQREWRDLGNKEANALFLRQPQLAAAQALLQSAQADYEQAQLNLERTNVSVPFDGRIRQTQVDMGQYVTPGTPIASVYDTSVAVIRLPLTDRQIALVDLPLGFDAGNTGAAPDVDSGAGPGPVITTMKKTANPRGPAVSISAIIAGKRYFWQGHIARTEASLDTSTRLYYAIAEVQDPFRVTGNFLNNDQVQAPLIVGLFVEAEIQGRELENVITIPHTALFKRNHIYTLDKQNRVHDKTVTLLHSNGKQAWIRGDLQKGEPIVVGRQSFLSEGIVVSPQIEHKQVAGS
ncbi:efflux RND transporter periplasmic adaptor subunit [Aestuariicella hydrocarbonica]|uniref:Efflux RND transporter periplasmic adaptor subunit n=1 Tax=Pseudomaricurvus hydrocarbonicus TaxID=1470433 RepID=A0A9E5JTM6_9GAMM|nr:efflux RND transporter periplasmic adaptor subunit [Aestuariicella hydrocarbonica]